MTYDPRLAALIARTEDEWGDPAQNMKNLVFYGINYIDNTLYGIDVIRGELIGIQAEAKMRKSTLLANIILNIAATKRFWLVIDTLESGMPPSAYRDVLIAITATRMLIAQVFGNDRRQWPDYDDMLAHPDLGPALRISKEFLWYGKRTEEQYKAIEASKLYLSSLPIMIFGPASEEGRARDLNYSMNRWQSLFDGTWVGSPGCQVRIFASDHLQQLDGFGESDYIKLEAAIGSHSSFIARNKGAVVIDVSQLGVGSVRLERQGIARGMAKGGAKLEAEANVLFRTRYDRNNPAYVKIELDATRRSPPPPVLQNLDPASGAFLGPARLAK